MNNKILIADDEYRMRKLVADFFKKEGFLVIEAEDGKKAVDLFVENQDINLVILDVMMPEFDGWVVCREIRKLSKVPIIMLTARSQESDELFGFDLGADEYITKPFSPNILVARAKALLRRLEKEKDKIWELDNLVINEDGHCAMLDEEILDLSPTEYELLLYLVTNKGKALSREQILNAVWNYDYLGETRTVDTNIKRLRTKLKDKRECIQTVRGVGYRFEWKDEKLN